MMAANANHPLFDVGRSTPGPAAAVASNKTMLKRPNIPRPSHENRVVARLTTPPSRKGLGGRRRNSGLLLNSILERVLLTVRGMARLC